MKASTAAVRARSRDPEVQADWELFKREGDCEARNRLAENYQPIVHRTASKILSGLNCTVQYDDLVGAGQLGLLDAIDKFDPFRKIRFRTYSLLRIRGSIFDELREMDWVPRSVRLKANQVNQCREALRGELGRPPLDYEMADRLDLTIEEFLELSDEAYTMRFSNLHWKDSDGERTDDWTEEFEDTAHARENDPLRVLEEKEVLRFMCRSLSKNEKMIVIMYYYEGLTMREIGHILDLTESRVCQIRSTLLPKLASLKQRFEKESIIC